MPTEGLIDVFSPSERERILAAMAELCAQRGYGETRIEDVATRAGLPVEKFEEHFGEDKARCVHAAVTEMLGEVMSEVSSSYSADRLEWDSFLLGIKAILELMAANPSRAHLCYVTVRQMGPDHRLAELYRTGIQTLAVLLERLAGYPDGDAPSQYAARASMGAAEAVVRREIIAGRAEELPRYLPDFIYAATIAFLGQEKALQMAQRGRELLAGTEWEPA